MFSESYFIEEILFRKNYQIDQIKHKLQTLHENVARKFRM